MGCKSRNHWAIPHCVRKAYCVGKCRTCLNFKNYKAKAWVADGPITTTDRVFNKKMLKKIRRKIARQAAKKCTSQSM